MNEETATDRDTRTKRAKTDPNVAPLDNSSTSKTPKSQAQEFVSAHVESLHYHVATILTKIGFDHINLIHKLLNKINQKTKMELDPSLFPRSARIDFTIKSSKKVEELPDYIQLKEETEIYVREVKENLKARILVAADLEITSLRQEILEHFVKGSFLVAKTLKIGEGEPDANIHGIISDIIHTHHETLLPHFMTDLAKFKELYQTLLNIETFPTPETAPEPSQQLVVLSPHFGNNAARPAPIPTPMSTSTSNINRTIECLFITSIERYSEQEKKNEININLKKLDINHLTEPATAAAELEVSNEQSVTPENLKELIAKETKIATAALLKELNSLRAIVNSTSVKGKGARQTKRGASTKKKQTKKTGKTVSFAASVAPPADAADSDSSKKKRNNRSDSSKKKKGKKGKKSGTGKTK